ncbi:MAG: heme-degrading domain-containing protein [Chloroflexota bacterium]|nr:heme-degrading domain-containing protein [Chloroflexota bacterium]
MTDPEVATTAPTIEELEAQERRLVLPAADLATLHALGRHLYDAAVERGLPLTIQLRLGERLVFSASAPGSTAVNERWADRKARVVRFFEHSSLLVRRIHERDGIDVNATHSLPVERFAAHGGAFPLRVASVGFVGSVVVSGLPQVEDHLFVVETLDAFIADR